MITKTTASPLKKSAGDIVPLDTSANLGIGLSSPIGTIDADMGSSGWTINEVTLADDASVALETLLPTVGQGMLWICDVSDNNYRVAGWVFCEGSDDNVTQGADPMNRITVNSATPANGQLGINGDGDGTYTLINNIGLEKTFALQWLGQD